MIIKEIFNEIKWIKRINDYNDQLYEENKRLGELNNELEDLVYKLDEQNNKLVDEIIRLRNEVYEKDQLINWNERLEKIGL